MSGLQPGELTRVFDGLKSPSPDVLPVFAAAAIEGHESALIGRDAEGRPALIFSTVAQGSAGWPPAIELRNIRASFGTRCRLTASGTDDVRECVLIQCLSSDSALHGVFLSTVGGLLVMVPAKPTSAQITNAVDQLVELFEALQRPARKSTQGLWGELLLIAQATDVAMMLASWHPNPNDRFDFSRGPLRIEVKTCVRPGRVHHFRLDQLKDDKLRICIASLVVESAGGGASIADLTSMIRAIVVDESAASRIDRMVLQTLGQDWREASLERFDLDLAAASCLFVSSSEVPAIPCEPPTQVSNVGFRSDISGLGSIGTIAMAAAGELWGAVIPRPHFP